MNKAKVYEKRMVIPTYGVGREEKNPMFFEKRVYQGSSGKVYPNAVIEKIYDEKRDKEYNAVILENDWLYVIVLPELGGRIYTAYDKTNGYDFVYHNRVIKPALVGLLGPWISGGIEFNWPQHHRPTTFMPANYRLKEYEDGSVSVLVGESEAMFSLKHTSEIKLYADRAYIEISTDVYNRGETTETFLWWANPAYRVNDDTATIMPADVTAVMDHGKRAVSTFPIATGEYYKMDYSKGVDISRYKNIPVPTSFMAYKSNFDFVGGYDYGKRAGLLHVADHHVSTGKKQWTWGSGDFGVAWDRNLTDEDGPYVELMTGCFTDNQPDFTFIRPHETKSFTQYFMPYHEVGRVLNADENICFGAEDGILTVYANIYADIAVKVERDGETVYSDKIKLAPTEAKRLVKIAENCKITAEYAGKRLCFSPSMVEKFDIPSPATACPEPGECRSNEELYLCGLHIEQYRHATRLAEDYHLEGLKRDINDIRINNAYGLLLLKRGRAEESVTYFERAIERSTYKNPNPRDTECYFNYGISLFILGDIDKAYDAFYKCLWGADKAMARYYLAVIDCIRGKRDKAIEHARECVLLAGRDTRALNTLGRLYKDAGEDKKAAECFNRANRLDGLDVVSAYELADSNGLKNASADEIKILSGDYIMERRYEEAERFILKWREETGRDNALLALYRAYARLMQGKSYSDEIANAEKLAEETVVFAISLTDIKVLEKLLENCDSYYISYLLGNVYYDKKGYDTAAEYWHRAIKVKEDFPTAYRNLALYYYNKKKDKDRAFEYMERAFALDKTDSRVLLELYELYSIMGKSAAEKFRLLEENIDAVSYRDDLYIEYLALLADNGDIDKAYDAVTTRKFHPWEGGEGKVTKLYKRLNVMLAERALSAGDYNAARDAYSRCFAFPHNLGEGKLILDYDNDICYMLGLLEEKAGNAEKAKEYFKMATRGDMRVADDMYYNDNPVDYVYYAALAYRKLGENEQADDIKNAFIKYYDNHISKEAVIDYFAVSLPDMLIWEQDLNERNREFCAQLKGLAEKI